MLEGKVQHHGRFAFLLAEEPGREDLLLRGPSLRLAMDGDRVQARLTPGDRGRPAGEIVKVLERARARVTGVLRQLSGKWIAVPEEADERDAIRVVGFGPGIMPREGEVVVVLITQWPTLQESAGGEVCEALGLPESPGVRLRAILRTRDLPETFPEDVLAESRAFPAAVSPAMWEGRLDLRDLAIFTIDGADAKDFDDAVSLEVLDSSTMRLGVHIADVSYYVKKGSALDREAGQRATSVYLADRVVPMLPPNLSDHLCSLRPDVERLTLSCFMDVDSEGRVRDSFLKETVIRSRRRFTYEEVESALNGAPPAGLDPEVLDSLARMGVLFKTLTRQRMKRGALDMTSQEYKVVVDSHGAPLDVVKRQRLASHRLIEEFMLLANETVALALLRRRLPFLSRVHPDPDARKLEILGSELRKLGVFAPASLVKSPAATMQVVLRNALGHPLEDMINMLVMRSLKQASYSHRPGTHFGLASSAYCHFTSPIRRYPDLLTHRAVKALLSGLPDDSLAAGLKGAGEHCSARERVAAEAERLSVDILRAELLKAKVGQVFEGVVTGSAAFGLFVTLEGLGSSGLVRNANAALGTKVKVKLDRVDGGKGELDFSLVSAGRPVPPPTGKPKWEPRKEKPKWEPRGDKPKWESRARPPFDPSKPRPPYDPSKRKFEPRGDKPKWESRARPPFDPSKPRAPYDPSKKKFDSRKPRFDPRAPRAPHDPSKPKFDPRTGKAKWEPRGDKPKWNSKSKPRFDPKKPRFKSRFDPKKPRRP